MWYDNASAFLFGYPGDAQTEEVRRKVDGYKLLLKTGMLEEDRKGEQHFDDVIRRPKLNLRTSLSFSEHLCIKCGLWFYYTSTFSWSVSFLTQIIVLKAEYISSSLVLEPFVGGNQLNQMYLEGNANSRQDVLEGSFSWKATVLTAQPSCQLDGLSKFHMQVTHDHHFERKTVTFWSRIWNFPVFFFSTGCLFPSFWSFLFISFLENRVART